MAKGKKEKNLTYEQKKALFWEAIMSDKQRLVREGLVNTGMEAQTRNQDGLTSIMLAALNGKVKSLDTLLDYYERRRELRRRGWINIKDDNGRTSLMMAAAAGKVECVKSLLLKEARTDLKDDDGMTARDHAEKRRKAEVVKMIDDWLAESEEEDLEDEEGNVIGEGLSSRERSKLKKKMLQAQERRGQVAADDLKKPGAEEEEDDGEVGPLPIWPEVQKVVQSVELLQPISEIQIIRDAPEDNIPGGLDPALFYQRSINRLDVRLAPGVLKSLDGSLLARMKKLITLVLNGNSLESLPEEIGKLKNLRILEVARNQLQALPSTLNQCKSLEVIDASWNSLTSISPLKGLSMLASINIANNNIAQLDLDFEGWGRLHDLIISNNEITELPEEIAQFTGLTNLTAEGNEIEEIPPEIGQLKKIITFKLDNNPIKDPKMRRLVAGEFNKKQTWTYLQKLAKQKNGRKGGKKGGAGSQSASSDQEGAATSPPKAPREDADDEDDSGFESDSDFSITMDEL